MKYPGKIFITGTDTGVGKTILSLLMIRYFQRIGAHPFYIKPFQTGCTHPEDMDSDAGFVHLNSGMPDKVDPGDSIVYCIPNPKAPYFAARDNGQLIDPEDVIDFVLEKSRHYHPLIIEGAGGLMVPVTRDTLMIDMIPKLDAQTIVAARAGLGTINHTLLSLAALQKQNIDPLGVVFMNPGSPGVPRDMIEENMEAVEVFSGIKPAGVIHQIDDLTGPDESCLAVFDRLFTINTGKIQ